MIPSYARPEKLRGCLQALAAQSRLPDEVIVVVRPSDEATAAEARRSWSPLSVKLVPTYAEGIIDAEAAGVACARGEVIGFIDDDAVPGSEWCERVASWYASEDVGAVGGPILPPSVEDRQTAAGDICRVRPWGAVVNGTHKIVACPREVDHLRGCNMSVRRAFAAFDRALLGYCYRWELDICLSVRGAGLRVIYDPAAWVIHYQAGRVEDAREIRCRQANNTYVLLKHFPPHRRLAFLLYTMLWGDAGNPGIGQYLAWLLKHRQPRLLARALLPGMAGKLAGLWLLLANRRSGPRLREPNQGSLRRPPSACTFAQRIAHEEE